MENKKQDLLIELVKLESLFQDHKIKLTQELLIIANKLFELKVKIKEL